MKFNSSKDVLARIAEIEGTLPALLAEVKAAAAAAAQAVVDGAGLAEALKRTTESRDRLESTKAALTGLDELWFNTRTKEIEDHDAKALKVRDDGYYAAKEAIEEALKPIAAVLARYLPNADAAVKELGENMTDSVLEVLNSAYGTEVQSTGPMPSKPLRRGATGYRNVVRQGYEVELTPEEVA